MFDANGRVPMEGFLTDSMDLTVDICSVISISDCQYTVPDILRFINLKIPFGYSNNPGSYEECLGNTDYESRYCTVFYRGQGLGGLLRAQKENKFSTRSINNLTLHAFNENSISSYTKELCKYTMSNQETLKRQIIFYIMAIYSAVNFPQIGICIPKSCTAEDVNINYAAAITHQETQNNNHAMETIFSMTTSAEQCFTSSNRTGTSQDMPTANILFYLLLVLFGVLILAGTAYDIFILKTKVEKKPTGFRRKFLLSFSIYTNGKHLLDTSSSGSGHLDCLNGIRFLSMTWVVVGHSFMSGQYTMAVRNTKTLLDYTDGGGGLSLEVLLNAFPSVDTFFLMSGTLTSYILFRELEGAGSNRLKHSVTLMLYYITRYFRITITYAMFLGIVIFVSPYVYYGPLWNRKLQASDKCAEVWWLHLLYVHTLVEGGKGCVGLAWYLVDEMMFHWFSPFIIYPMHFVYEKTKSHVAPFVWWLFTLIIFTGVVLYYAFTTKKPPMTLNNVVVEGYNTEELYQNAPWLRYQGYLIGILLGYTLHHTRSRDIKIGFIVNILLWQAAFLSGFAVVYGLYDVRVSKTISLFEVATYCTFQRIAWSGAVAWTIFSCVKGQY